VVPVHPHESPHRRRGAGMVSPITVVVVLLPESQRREHTGAAEPKHGLQTCPGWHWAPAPTRVGWLWAARGVRDPTAASYSGAEFASLSTGRSAAHLAPCCVTIHGGQYRWYGRSPRSRGPHFLRSLPACPLAAGLQDHPACAPWDFREHHLVGPVHAGLRAGATGGREGELNGRRRPCLPSPRWRR